MIVLGINSSSFASMLLVNRFEVLNAGSENNMHLVIVFVARITLFYYYFERSSSRKEKKIVPSSISIGTTYLFQGEKGYI